MYNIKEAAEKTGLSEEAIINAYNLFHERGLITNKVGFTRIKDGDKYRYVFVFKKKDIETIYRFFYDLDAARISSLYGSSHVEPSYIDNSKLDYHQIYDKVHKALSYVEDKVLPSKE